MYKNDVDYGGLEAGDNPYANEMMFRRSPPAPMMVNTEPTETGKGDSCFQKKWSKTTKVSLLVVIALLCILLILLIILGVLLNITKGSCKTCPPGWNLIRSNCYYFSTIRENWERGKELCAERNGILVVIKDESEMSSLWPFIQEEAFWIGLRRDPKDIDSWVWTDGSPLTYSAWYEGEPNNLENIEHCVETWGVVKSWNDRLCQENQSYICRGVWN